MKTLRRFVQLPWARQSLLMEAAWWLALAWLLVRALPFRFWSHWLGEPAPGEANPTSAGSNARAGDTCWAVIAINTRLGGRFTCLMLAMAAHWMLSRRRISSSLVLGTLTEQDADKRLAIKAHAWLRVGGQVVLGNHDGRYTAISSFIRSHCQPDGPSP